MKPESRFWKKIKSGMKKHWLADRIENLVGDSIPDVAYTVPEGHGWIELKVLKEWPKRANTLVKIKHFTDGQRRWLKNHGEMGGSCFVFLKVEKDYMLYTWAQAQLIGSLTQEQMKSILYCFNYWKNHIDYEQLANVIAPGEPVHEDEEGWTL